MPAAKVFCRVLPSAASAMAGPKEEKRAMVGISTPSKPTVPLWQSRAETNSMIKSKASTTALVTAELRPEVRFIRSSSLARLSVFSFICASRFLPCPYCRVSDRPRRLSSTKPESSPDFVRNFIPSSPLSLEVTIGITIPTIKYAVSAMSPSSQ